MPVQSSRSIGKAATLAALLLLLSALPLSAQVLRGRVLNAESERPVAEAVILIFAGTTLIDGVEADSLGNFEVALPAAGEYTLTVNKAGFMGVGPAAFNAPADRILDVVITMSDAVIVLDPLAVNVNATPRTSIDGARRRSTQNRRLGVGAHMNQDEIRKSQRVETGDLITSMLAQIQYADIRPPMVASPGGRGYSPAAGALPERLVGVTRLGRFCPLALFVDGVAVGRGDAAVLPHPDEIDTVEVYLGSHVEAGFYDRGGCGFALVTTGRTHGAAGYRRTLLGSSILASMLAIAILAR
jgi:hypothetical protein